MIQNKGRKKVNQIIVHVSKESDALNFIFSKYFQKIL